MASRLVVGPHCSWRSKLKARSSLGPHTPDLGGRRAAARKSARAKPGCAHLRQGDTMARSDISFNSARLVRVRGRIELATNSAQLSDERGHVSRPARSGVARVFLLKAPAAQQRAAAA